ncbi:MAG: zf-HC2 domain-containing protein [Bacteroidetes bacterium]|nr:zf-HC2 domain-containing protein [Bacteroidota bacterium]
MNCDKNKEMIQLYVDGELEKEKEAYVFTHLSGCDECRLFFRTLNTISANIHKEEFPNELENRIFNSISAKETKRENRFFRKIFVRAVSYAVVLFLIAASIFLYQQTNNYKSIVEDMSEQIHSQAQTIDLLYNTLPPTVVHAKFDHEIIIKAKM